MVIGIHFGVWSPPMEMRSFREKTFRYACVCILNSKVNHVQPVMARPHEGELEPRIVGRLQKATVKRTIPKWTDVGIIPVEGEGTEAVVGGGDAGCGGKNRQRQKSRCCRRFHFQIFDGTSDSRLRFTPQPGFPGSNVPFP